MTRSIASSRVASVICVPLPRAVSRAPSLSTLARSAPVKPGVRRATVSRSTSGARGGARGAVAGGGGPGALVEDVGGVGAGEAGGAARDGLEVDVGGERLALGVHLEDLLAAPAAGPADGDR